MHKEINNPESDKIAVQAAVINQKIVQQSLNNNNCKLFYTPNIKFVAH